MDLLGSLIASIRCVILCQILSERCPGDCDPCGALTLIPRAQWGARSTRASTNLTLPTPHVFIHHTAGENCTTQRDCSETVRRIQDFHMDGRGWDDIGYSFLIGGDGRVYVGRGWHRQGAHTYRYNAVSQGVALMGLYTERAPPQNMLDATRRLIQCGVSKGYISEDYSLQGHRDVRCTECPGTAFYKVLETWDHWHSIPVKEPNCTEI